MMTYNTFLAKKNILSNEFRKIDSSHTNDLHIIENEYEQYISQINQIELENENLPPHKVRSMKGRKVYLFNNELDPPKEFLPYKSRSIDTIIVPSSGFFANNLVNYLDSSPSEIIYYDSFPVGLKMKKYVNEQIKDINALKKLTKLKFVSAVKQDHDLSQETLVNLKNITKRYCEIDIIDSPEKILSEIKGIEYPWLWISNIYTFNVNIFTYGPTQLFESFMYLMRELKKHNPKAIVQGKTPWGKYFISEAKEFYLENMGFTPSWERKYINWS